MTIRIHDEGQSEAERRNVVPPPDYFSRAVKLKLFMLVGLLGLVLLLMNEARKPENWAWMGFGEEPAQQLDPGEREPEEDSGFTAVPLPPPLNSSDSEDGDAVSGDESDDLATGGDSGVEETGSENESVYIPVDPDFEFDSARIQFSGKPLESRAATVFWRTIFNNYSRSNRALLFRILRYARNGQAVPDDMASGFRSMLAELSAGRDDYHTRLLENLASLSDSAVQKPALNQQYFESKDLWEQQVLPAMLSTIDGGDITMQQLETLNGLQLTLDKFAYAEVNDRTSLNQPDEGHAWLRCWESALNPGTGEFESVTHIELSGQAGSFRGQPVSISGTVRAARLARMRQNEIGLDSYYVLWLLPDDTNLSPYCVYSTSVPEGLTEIGQATVELDEPATINGIFFKIRTYESAGNEVLYSPMLLASSVELFNQQGASAPLVELPEPDMTGTIIGILAMVLIAGYLAWRGYSVTQMVRRIPDRVTSDRINRNLELLADDPGIKSDLENIQMLSEKEELE